MERTAAEKLRLGVLVILGTITFIVAVYLIGNRQNMFGNTLTVTTVFKNVNGLQKGNNVRYAGIDVGTVKAIEMVNDTTINVHMLIDEKMKAHIKTNAVATIGSDGLVGSMIVNVVPGVGEAPFVSAGDKIASYSRIGAEDMLSTLNVTNQNAALLTSDLLRVTESLNNGEGTLGKLLNDKEMAANLEQTIYNLKSASSKANNTLAELQTVIEQMGKGENVAGVLFADSLSTVKMKDVITNLEVSSRSMSSLVQRLDSAVVHLVAEDGVVNYLSRDTVLVGNLKRTMKNIEEGTASFNENMEALKHSFLTRRYFKKMEKEQARN
ncbi:MlaD family protein [Poritiphilus flavus]|uniref:MCE family protein n=1 Tax=Poritiphilus flavus TaxID=2697053 RepID=A0A6L9EI80_9FLAO|nr:MlaD family protein [Poritiphilus flavus]NAS14451.1 MCE family protein [Poritiphilus flavus]